jgi:hypothetical protein
LQSGQINNQLGGIWNYFLYVLVEQASKAELFVLAERANKSGIILLIYLRSGQINQVEFGHGLPLELFHRSM